MAAKLSKHIAGRRGLTVWWTFACQAGSLAEKGGIETITGAPKSEMPPARPGVATLVSVTSFQQRLGYTGFPEQPPMMPHPATYERPGPTRREPWRGFALAGFRFSFCYFALYCFPFPFVFIDDGSEPFAAFWHRAVPWIAARLFNGTIRPPRGVGGDTPYDWALCAVLLSIAGIATLIWSAVDRKPVRNIALNRWIRLYVGLYLGVQLLSYGFAKALGTQFHPSTLSRLSLPIGDLSRPQALLWTSMGESRMYQSFAGWVEVVAGMLLFIPRLASIGALLSCAATANVLALNLGYDINVKLFSLHLLAMSLFVFAPELPVLIKVVVLRRPVEPRSQEPFFQKKWLHRSVLAAVAVYGIGVSAHFVARGLRDARAPARSLSSAPFHGVWNVDEFSLDGAVRPPLLTDQARWRQAIFDYGLCCEADGVFPGFLVMPMNVPIGRPYWMRFESSTNRLELMKATGPKPRTWRFDTLTVSIPASNRLVLDGNLEGHRVHVALVRAPDFPLRSHQFHWIH